MIKSLRTIPVFLCLLLISAPALAAEGDLAWSAVLGGTAADLGTSVATGADGSTYLTGQSASLDYPTENAYQAQNAGATDVVVSRLNPQGSAIVWSTYLGGSGDELARDIQVDGQGRVWICGDTRSADFPVTSGALQSAYAGGTFDAFVAILDGNSGNLIYATYIGGTGADYGMALAPHPDGGVVVAGATSSSDFPTTPSTIKPSWTPTFFDGSEAFLLRLEEGGRNLVWSTYIGSTGTDLVTALHVDGAGVPTVAGHTTSLGFPVSPDAFQREHKLDWDGFAMRLHADARGIYFSTFFGGDGKDQVLGMAVDSSGDIILSGKTTSTDLPVSSGAAQQSYGGGSYDGFLARLGNDGRSLVYGTFLGGSGEDVLVRTVPLPDGGACVVGQTASSGYPVSGAGADLSHDGGLDAVVTIVASNGSLRWSSFLGGPQDDMAQGVAWDPRGRVVAAGSTESSSYPSGNLDGSPGLPTVGASDATVTEIEVQAAEPTGVPTVASFSLGAPSPNPSSGRFAMRMDTQNAGEVSLRVIDARGRVVREESPRALGAGQHYLRWDGRIANGLEAPAGVYFLEVRWGAAREVRRAIIVR